MKTSGNKKLKAGKVTQVGDFVFLLFGGFCGAWRIIP